MPERQDVSYFFSHPSHPPIFNDETEAEARRDFFGGVAKLSIVRALLQGPEEDYAKGEVIASKLFGPILRSHRISIEQMAILFDGIDWELSDGAKEAVADAMPVIFQPDWKKVFDAEQLRVSPRKITEIK